MFTKEMIEKDLKKLIGIYNKSNNHLEKRFIKIGIRHNRSLIQYFEKRGVTEIPMLEMVCLMNTRYRYVKEKLYKLERKGAKNAN